MQRVILLVITSILLIVGNLTRIQGQSTKIDFNAEWKADSIKNIVKITIIEGEPQSIMLYDKSPFEEGRLLNKTDVLSNKTIEIQMGMKIKLCVCVIKDAAIFSCKWLDVEK